MMTFGDIKDDLYRMIGVKSNSAREDISVAVKTAIRRAQEKFVNWGDWSFLEQYTDRVDIPLQLPYETGTVTVTQDSKTVTGSGTTFTKDMEGSFFTVNETDFYEIRSYESATGLTLNIPYQGDSESGVTYRIYKRYYPLPLDFVRPHAREAKLSTSGTNQQDAIAYHSDASFTDKIVTGKPQWFGIVGNTRRTDYFNTGTVTIATASGVSTWTISSGTLPTDIVDREVRISGESRSYWIKTRATNSTFTTYDVYVNPLTGLNTQTTASSYAITPKETLLVAFSPLPEDTRYVFSLPYVKRLQEMLLDSDVSPIVLAGYEDAFLAICRQILAEDGRTSMRGDQVTQLIRAGELALQLAWNQEQMAETHKWQGARKRDDRIQVGPSWIAR